MQEHQERLAKSLQTKKVWKINISQTWLLWHLLTVLNVIYNMSGCVVCSCMLVREGGVKELNQELSSISLEKAKVVGAQVLPFYEVLVSYKFRHTWTSIYSMYVHICLNAVAQFYCPLHSTAMTGDIHNGTELVRPIQYMFFGWIKGAVGKSSDQIDP